MAPTTSPSTYLTRLREYPTSTIKEQVKKFLRVCGWIRDYIPRFADIAAPLTDLLGNKQQSFEDVKAAFDIPLNLSPSYFNQPFTL